MKISVRQPRAAFTLIEMLMSVACGSLLLAAVIISGVALQRSFMAVEGYAVSEGDQLRVLDYIAMDCRRAMTASISNNVLTLTLPPYYNSSGVVQTPTLTTGILSYGSGSVTITYQQSGTDFTRTVLVTDSAGNTTSSTTAAIASNVSNFTVTPQDLTTSLSCSITFSPRFTYLPGPGPIAGTTVYCDTFLRNAGARQ